MFTLHKTPVSMKTKGQSFSIRAILKWSSKAEGETTGRAGPTASGAQSPSQLGLHVRATCRGAQESNTQATWASWINQERSLGWCEI